jgi:hypothetical protein
VALLARHGFRTWGLEISQGAVDAANENIKPQLDPSAGQHADVVLGDFFQKEFETYFGSDFQGFDLIYDYTVRPACRVPTDQCFHDGANEADLVLVCPSP